MRMYTWWKHEYEICSLYVRVRISVMVSTVIAGNNVSFARLGMLAPGIELAKYDISIKYGCVNGFLFIVYEFMIECVCVSMYACGKLATCDKMLLCVHMYVYV